MIVKKYINGCLCSFKLQLKLLIIFHNPNAERNFVQVSQLTKLGILVPC